MARPRACPAATCTWTTNTMLRRARSRATTFARQSMHARPRSRPLATRILPRWHQGAYDAALWSVSARARTTADRVRCAPLHGRGAHACLRVCARACLCACCVLLCVRARVCAATVAVAVCAVPSVPCRQSVRVYECCTCVGSVRVCARVCVDSVAAAVKIGIGLKTSGPPALGPLAL